MSREKKLLIGAGVVVVLALLAFQALRAGRGEVHEVRATVVTSRDLVARVSASGHIQPKRSVDISTDVMGRVVRLEVREGGLVREGDLLLVIDPTRLEAQVRQARARLAEARSREAQRRADHLQAAREWDRIRQLKERTPDLVTDQEAERARTQAEVAEASWTAARSAVEQAEAALEEAEDQLAKTVIRAPMSGRVTRVNVEQGETAVVGTMNNPGSLLLTIADLSLMEAVVEVDETDIPLVSPGDSAVVEVDAFPDRSLPGRVTEIGNSAIREAGAPTTRAAERAVDYEVRITLDDPPPGIRPDLSCTAEIITDRRADALAIPILSLTLSRPDEARNGGPGGEDGTGEAEEPDETEGVFVVEGGRARFRPVEVGITGEGHFEVVEGLSEGDTVVSGTYRAIRDLVDGARVKLTDVRRTGRADAADAGS